MGHLDLTSGEHLFIVVGLAGIKTSCLKAGAQARDRQEMRLHG